MADPKTLKHLLDQVRDFKKRNEDNPELVISEHDLNIIVLADEIERLTINGKKLVKYNTERFNDQKRLHEANLRLTAEGRVIKDATRPFWTWMYNQGYAQGHHDTVEGMYTDVLPVDMETYHDDIVSDLLAEYSRLDSASGRREPKPGEIDEHFAAEHASADSRHEPEGG